MEAPLTVPDFCRAILERGSLEEKLRAPSLPDGGLLPDAELPARSEDLPRPARDQGLRMGSGAERLPALSELADVPARIACLERFAHHELQAVELFAWALLAYPDLPGPLRRGLLQTLAEEQGHLRLYLGRLDALGSTLPRGVSSAPLSDYFWKHVPALAASPHGVKAFLCAMGLTLEQANLDFTLLYRDAFARVGDQASAAVLDQVHKDEIRHVKLAATWLDRLRRPEQSDVEAYIEAIPFPLSAARAKGRRFDLAARRKAGLSAEMIAHVKGARPYGKLPARGTLRLWANFGAEEGDPRWPAPLAGLLRRLGDLWALLFAPEELKPPCVSDPGAVAREPGWPSWLGAPPRGAAFPWLDGWHGLVPWLSTSEAERTASTLGLPLRASLPDVVQRVHDKGYGPRLVLEPEVLRDLIVVLDPALLVDPVRTKEVLEAALARWPDWARGRYTLKPRFGTSGRGRVPGQGVIVGEPLLNALPRLAARGGAVLEPWLDRVCDLSAQWYVDPSGTPLLIGTTEMILTPSGAYLGNHGIVDAAGNARSGSQHDAALIEGSVRLVEAAAADGFRGPCGVDAFAFRGPAGEEMLRPAVELNARFTSGVVALGLLARLAAAGRISGSDRRWRFLLGGPQVDASVPPLMLS